MTMSRSSSVIWWKRCGTPAGTNSVSPRWTGRVWSPAVNTRVPDEHDVDLVLGVRLLSVVAPDGKT